MKTILKRAIVIILVLTLLVLLFQTARFFTLPQMQTDAFIYNSHEYVPLSGNYGTNLRSTDVRFDKAVGRFNDAIIYTLKDDPNEVYLFPKVILPHLTYNFWIRQDALPLIEEENVEQVLLYIPADEDKSNAALQPVQLDMETANMIICALQSTDNNLPDSLSNMYDSEIYELKICFSEPKDLYYQTVIVRHGNDWGILLEDGQTLAVIDGVSISILVEKTKGCN